MKLANLVRGNDRGAIALRALLCLALVATSSLAGLLIGAGGIANAGSGTVKVDGDDLNGNSNNPHRACEIEVSWDGFDPGAYTSTVYFEQQGGPGGGLPIATTPPSGNNSPSASETFTVLPNGPSPTKTYAINPAGLTLTKQGYHLSIRVEVRTATGSVYDKSKVIFALACDTRVSVTKNNDANGDASYSDDESATAPGQAVSFQIVINNPGAAFTIKSVTDEWTGQSAKNVCASLINTTVAGGGQAACTWTESSYSPAHGSAVTNTVKVGVASAADPAVTANGQDTSTVRTPSQAPDLTLNKSAPANAIAGAAGNAYLLTVTNAGPVATVGTITVTDVLPSGVTAGVMPAGCTLTGGTITCTSNAALAPSSTVAFSIPVTFTTAGTVLNSALVAGGGESNTANNGAFASTVVSTAPVPDLTLAKAAPATATTGAGGTYLLTVTNSGTASTTGTITVTDSLPAGVTPGAMPAGCTISAQTVSCTSSTPLPQGGTVAFSVPVTFTTAGTVVNNAAVAGGGESNTGNNGATASTVVSDGSQGPSNRPPNAVDDSASTAFGAPVTIAVLGNDSDPDGDPLTITEAANGVHGTVTAFVSEGAALRLRGSLSAPTTGALVYTPAAGFSGTDSFSYVVSDGRGGTDSALVTVAVAGPGASPSPSASVSPSPSASPISGVTSPEPATSGSPSPAASSSPLPQLPFAEEEPSEAPAALPFTGSSTDQLLALGALLCLMGLLLIVTGRRRRTAG